MINSELIQIKSEKGFGTHSGIPDLGPEEAVTLLFYIIVNDTRHFFLPDFKAIYADVVLDVLKRPVESIHGGSHFLQLGHELTGLKDSKII